MKLSITMAFAATIVSALVIFALRAFPFVLFSRRNPPHVLRFIEKYIPPMVMAILLVYCLKDIQFTQTPYGAPYFIALAATIALHIWKKNSMISIFGGTALFMILKAVL